MLRAVARLGGVGGGPGPGTGNGLGEAPNDGQIYGRDGLLGTWVPVLSIGAANANFLTLAAANATFLTQSNAFAQYLPRAGGQMSGDINMAGNFITGLPLVPQGPDSAVSMQWVEQQIAATSLYQGTWNPHTNTPNLLNPNLWQNDFAWIVVLEDIERPAIVTQAIPGLQGQRLFNGDHVIYSTVAGQFQIVRGGDLSLTEAESLFVMLDGSHMTGPLWLVGDATEALQAVTLAQLTHVADAAWRVTISDYLPPAPRESNLWWDSTDGSFYIRYQGAWVQTPGGFGVIQDGEIVFPPAGGGGDVQFPITIAQGGTGRTTAPAALDALSGQSGAVAGYLQRSAAGAWSLGTPSGGDGGGGGIPEPVGAGNWLRTGNQSWVQGLALTGGTVTGATTFSSTSAFNGVPRFNTQLGFAINTSDAYPATLRKEIPPGAAGGAITLRDGYSTNLLAHFTIASAATPPIRFYQDAGFDGTVTLNRDAAAALQAVPLRQVQALIAAGGGGGGLVEPLTLTQLLSANGGLYVGGQASINGNVAGHLFVNYADGSNAMLVRDAAKPLEAVPLRQVESLIAAIPPSTGGDGQPAGTLGTISWDVHYRDDRQRGLPTLQEYLDAHVNGRHFRWAGDGEPAVLMIDNTGAPARTAPIVIRDVWLQGLTLYVATNAQFASNLQISDVSGSVYLGSESFSWGSTTDFAGSILLQNVTGPATVTAGGRYNDVSIFGCPDARLDAMYSQLRINGTLTVQSSGLRIDGMSSGSHSYAMTHLDAGSRVDITASLGTVNLGDVAGRRQGWILDRRYGHPLETFSRGAMAITLGGDVTGTAANNVVARLLGRSMVFPPDIPTGSVLAWNGNQWVPTIIEGGVVEPPGPEVPEATPEIDYKLTEQDTGLRWLDGRPIFQRTWHLGARSSANHAVNHGIVSIGEIVRDVGTARIGGQWVAFTHAEGNSNAENTQSLTSYTTATHHNLRIRVAILESYYTLWYTRTSEATSSADGLRFSTVEQATGLRWLDGSPIYQITVDIGKTPNSAITPRLHNINDMEMLVQSWGWGGTNGSGGGPIPYYDSTQGPYSMGYRVTRTAIEAVNASNTDASAYDNYFYTLRYTKTGEGSAEPSDFSLSERDTGLKWLDNKPVYQKTFYFAGFAGSVVTTIAHGITGLEELVAAHGVADDGTTYHPLPYVHGQTVASFLGFRVDATNIRIIPGTAGVTGATYITLRYTKET